MTERERLIELLDNGCYEAINKCKGEDSNKKLCEFLADKLLENGVIVSPVKCGDTVYCIFHKKVIQGTVRLIRPFISKEKVVFKGNVIFEVDSLFEEGTKEEVELYVVFVNPYGNERVAYLTREAAEKVIKECKENDTTGSN